MIYTIEEKGTEELYLSTKNDEMLARNMYFLVEQGEDHKYIVCGYERKDDLVPAWIQEVTVAIQSYESMMEHQSYDPYYEPY